MKTDKIEYAKRNILSDDEFESKKTKVRITTFIDLDILEKLKEEAASCGSKYQTLLNEKLREVLIEEKTIKSTLTDLNKRLSDVENKMKAG